jgi:RluA family pseudouridine synthase
MNKTFEIVFQDESIVVVNKIARILVEPADDKKGGATLTSLLKEKIGAEVYPCHRLDRETSGLMIYAKSLLVQENIMAQFKAGTISKEYIAFAAGTFRTKDGIWEARIIDHEGRKKGEAPKIAKTAYHVIKDAGAFSLVSLKPFTGRTNQLRIQLANVGHPILGERKYAFGRDFKVKFRRLALHACFISFTHPITTQKLEFKLDLPLDMSNFLQK